MNTFRASIITALAVLSMSLFTASPARADFCLQLNGGALSGDLGFFRFAKRLPKKPGTFVPIVGRVAGLSPAFGAATVSDDGAVIEVAVTFFADAAEGQFDVWLTSSSQYTSGNGYADYGTYDVNVSHTVNVVNCSLEP
jgi:hypothetical protein